MGRVVLLALLVGWGGTKWAIRRRRLLRSRQRVVPERLPARLRTGRPGRTWVLVASRRAASGSLVARLCDLDPAARIVVVDASVRPVLARRLGVRATPELLLADGDGWVRHRLSGSPSGGRRF